MYVASIVIFTNWHRRTCKFLRRLLLAVALVVNCVDLMGVADFVDLIMNLQFDMAIAGSISQFE